VPIQPITAGFAKPDDPGTWTTFEEALSYYQAHKSTIDGIGFVFAKGGGIVGIDLDDCRDPDKDELLPWSRDAVDAIDSYTEVSPSGTGVKIFAFAAKPGDKCKRQ
jgi:primase-polymerase (primpol)-like protein